MNNMNEEQTKKISLTDKLDAYFAKKGKFLAFMWQFLKFTIVSFLTFAIQIALVYLLLFFMKDFKEPLPHFLAVIFSETTVGEGNSNWGYMLPFFISNLVANTFGYFMNKSKTFKSDAPLWHLVIYIVTLFILILISTWLQGVVVNALTATEIAFFVTLAPTIGSMAAGTLQFAAIFPLQKFVLLREKKADK